MLTIDSLAQEIRRVDGNHSLGAGALAEALIPFLTASLSEKQAGEVKIKPLEWYPDPGAFPYKTWGAQSSFGRFLIEKASASDSPAFEVRYTPHHLITITDGLLEAKAAAQADYEQRIRSALVDVPVEPVARKFELHDRVQKHSGAWWEGRVVGFYSTKQTPVGYCVQLDTVENGPVQIYPEAALEFSPASPPLSREGEDSAEVGRALEFVALWAWREDPSNAVRKLTDAERLSAIKHHPTIKALAATRSASATTHSGNGVADE